MVVSCLSTTYDETWTNETDSLVVNLGNFNPTELENQGTKFVCVSFSCFSGSLPTPFC